jgi:hypothetical protein
MRKLMVQKELDIQKFQKLVVIFDICSSTKIFDDLLKNENEKAWHSLITSMERFLLGSRDRIDFELYKFLGDGWIIISNPDIDRLVLFRLLDSINAFYKIRFTKLIVPKLTITVRNPGIKFGIDRGTLMMMDIDGKREYLGRPLNVASRLQNSIGQQDKIPAGKVLMSKSIYDRQKSELKEKYQVLNARRILRDISDEEYNCIKLILTSS